LTLLRLANNFARLFIFAQDKENGRTQFGTFAGHRSLQPARLM
jgi:hypothetical protein